jgi:hypothetical protein
MPSNELHKAMLLREITNHCTQGPEEKHEMHYQQYCRHTTDATYGTYAHLKTSLLQVMFLPLNSSALSFDASTSLLERVPV